MPGLRPRNHPTANGCHQDLTGPPWELCDDYAPPGNQDHSIDRARCCDTRRGDSRNHTPERIRYHDSLGDHRQRVRLRERLVSPAFGTARAEDPKCRELNRRYCPNSAFELARLRRARGDGTIHRADDDCGHSTGSLPASMHLLEGATVVSDIVTVSGAQVTGAHPYLPVTYQDMLASVNTYRARCRFGTREVGSRYGPSPSPG